MKKRTAQALCFWIPVKKWRKKSIATLKEFNISKTYANYKQYNHFYHDFLNHQVKPESVLIVEPNPYHGEILPGFVKYWQDAGYHVDVIMRIANYEENPFALFSAKEKPDIFPLQKWRIKSALKQKIIRNYDFLFISSSDYQETKECYLNYLGFKPQTRHGSFCIYHNCRNIEHYKENPAFFDKRLFVLNEFPLAAGKAKLLCPVYFGPVKTHSKNSLTKFVTIGRLSPNTRNCSQLLNAVEKLLAENITDFEVAIIGSGDLNIPPHLASHIKKLGRLSFPDMYARCQESDFLLALLDSENPAQKLYLEGITTGSKQLSLGMNLPLLIDKAFADVYGFNDEDSVLYQNDGLYQAMKQAVRMDEKTYARMCKNLSEHARKVYDKSLQNLCQSVKQVKE